MKRTQIIVVRHGQTVWNTERRFQGHLDSPLTPRGVSEAEALGRRLVNQRFDALYSSDLGRALETARIISAATAHPVNSDARLRERHLGAFQGKTGKEIGAAYPEAYEIYRRRDPDFIVPGGESLRQQAERNFSCLEELAERYAGACLVVVTHGGVLSAILRHVLSIPFDATRRFEFPNSSLNIFTFGDGYWTLRTWGDISHLADMD
jgi:probable phosphoglycerate mutase